MERPINFSTSMIPSSCVCERIEWFSYSAAVYRAKEYTLIFPIDFHLGIGHYWGVVNFYKNDQVVASQKTGIQCLKPGLLRRRSRVPRRQFAQYSLVLIVIAACISFIIRLKSEKEKVVMRYGILFFFGLSHPSLGSFVESSSRNTCL